MALPHDTEEYRDGNSISLDSHGVPVLNSGFVVNQNNDLTFEMLSAWANCTSEERYPGCARWKGEWSHEQRAFSEYIRRDPEFNRTADSIVAISCDDAMAFPGFAEDQEKQGNPGISDCNGNFIRHYTFGKERVRQDGSMIVMQALMEVVQKNLLKHHNTTFTKEWDPALVVDGGEDVEYEEEFEEIEEVVAAEEAQELRGAGTEEKAEEPATEEVQEAAIEIIEEQQNTDQDSQPETVEDAVPVILEGFVPVSSDD